MKGLAGLGSRSWRRLSECGGRVFNKRPCWEKGASAFSYPKQVAQRRPSGVGALPCHSASRTPCQAQTRVYALLATSRTGTRTNSRSLKRQSGQKPGAPCEDRRRWGTIGADQSLRYRTLVTFLVKPHLIHQKFKRQSGTLRFLPSCRTFIPPGLSCEGYGKRFLVHTSSGAGCHS